MWLERHAGQGCATRGKPGTGAQRPKSTSHFLLAVVPLRTTYLERRHERVVHVRAGPGMSPLKLAVFDTKRGAQGGAPEHLVRVRVRRVRVWVRVWVRVRVRVRERERKEAPRSTWRWCGWGCGCGCGCGRGCGRGCGWVTCAAWWLERSLATMSVASCAALTASCFGMTSIESANLGDG